MAAEEEFDRIDIRAREDVRTETNRNGSLREGARTYDATLSQGARDALSRLCGSPLPMGNSGKPLPGRGEVHETRSNVPLPGRALSVSPHPEGESSSGMQWFAGVMKQAVPFMQKLLPLLDGQIATAVANLITARPHTPPPAPRVDLEPIENGLAELQIQQASIKDHLADQNTALKQVEDHLDMVREATDRNTLEQQELVEDLKAIRSRVSLFALLFLGLLVVSVLLNVFLFLHIQRVLP